MSIIAEQAVPIATTPIAETQLITPQIPQIQPQMPLPANIIPGPQQIRT